MPLADCKKPHEGDQMTVVGIEYMLQSWLKKDVSGVPGWVPKKTRQPAGWGHRMIWRRSESGGDHIVIYSRIGMVENNVFVQSDCIPCVRFHGTLLFPPPLIQPPTRCAYSLNCNG